MTDKVQKIKEFLIGMAGAACCDAKTKKNIETIILPFVDSLQEKPVSIWHDASEIPEDKNWVLLTHRDGWYHVGRLYEGQHENLVISDGVSAFKLCEFKRWTYIDDLLKL